MGGTLGREPVAHGAAHELLVSTDVARLDVALIHHFLAEESTWARGIPRTLVERSIEQSLCFGGYLDARQVAFARVISDFATFAYLGDVFVLAPYRGRGYARRLMAEVLAHPRLQGLRRFMLMTSSAHALYASYGFAAPARPQDVMERFVADVYASAP